MYIHVYPRAVAYFADHRYTMYRTMHNKHKMFANACPLSDSHVTTAPVIWDIVFGLGSGETQVARLKVDDMITKSFPEYVYYTYIYIRTENYIFIYNIHTYAHTLICVYIYILLLYMYIYIYIHGKPKSCSISVFFHTSFSA